MSNYVRVCFFFLKNVLLASFEKHTQQSPICNRYRESGKTIINNKSCLIKKPSNFLWRLCWVLRFIKTGSRKELQWRTWGRRLNLSKTKQSLTCLHLQLQYVKTIGKKYLWEMHYWWQERRPICCHRSFRPFLPLLCRFSALNLTSAIH